MMRFKLARMGGATLALLLLGACLGRSAPVEFYMLEPERRAAIREAGASGAGFPLIAVGPVRIPEYLDRPQIVTAQGGNAYRVDEQHRWAERLDDNLGRVLAQNLESLVPARQVLTNASDRGQPADFRVVLTVLEFHVGPDGQALLSAQWNIRRGNETLVSRTSSLRAAASTTDYGKMVAALNQCVDRLSRTIADALKTLAAGVAPKR